MRFLMGTSKEEEEKNDDFYDWSETICSKHQNEFETRRRRRKSSNNICQVSAVNCQLAMEKLDCHRETSVFDCQFECTGHVRPPICVVFQFVWMVRGCMVTARTTFCLFAEFILCTQTWACCACSCCPRSWWLTVTLDCNQLINIETLLVLSGRQCLLVPRDPRVTGNDIFNYMEHAYAP